MEVHSLTPLLVCTLILYREKWREVGSGHLLTCLPQFMDSSSRSKRQRKKFLLQAAFGHAVLSQQPKQETDVEITAREQDTEPGCDFYRSVEDFGALN